MKSLNSNDFPDPTWETIDYARVRETIECLSAIVIFAVVMYCNEQDCGNARPTDALPSRPVADESSTSGPLHFESNLGLSVSLSSGEATFQRV